MVACTRAELVRSTALVGAADALAVFVIKLRVAFPCAVVHVDGALTRVRGVRGLVGAARARTVICAAAATSILTSLAIS